MSEYRDTWIEEVDDAGNVIRGFHWPFCEIQGCPNRICIGRSDRFCWPHSDSGVTLDQIIKQQNRRKRSKPRVKELA